MKTKILPIRWKMPMMALIAGTLFSCEPMDDSTWIYNETFLVNWKEAVPETGERPIGQEVIVAHLYGGEKYHQYFYLTPDGKKETNVECGKYKAIAIQGNEFVQDMDGFGTASIILPTNNDNELRETEIENNPTEMMYFGRIDKMEVYEEYKQTHTFHMRKALKKLTFMVSVLDNEELKDNCDIDISGLATRMSLANGAVDQETEAILKFSIPKKGRPLTEGEKKIQTKYKGSCYILGTSGKNVVRVTYTDSKGEKQTVEHDVTHKLKEWTTDEVGVVIRIDAETGMTNEWDWVDNYTEIDFDF